MNKNLKQIAVPLVSVLLGLVLGAIIMWAFSYGPFGDMNCYLRKPLVRLRVGNISVPWGH